MLRTLRALRLEERAEETVFVGDSPFDLRAGRGAGTRTAAGAWGPFAREALEAERPDYFLETMKDLLAIGP